MSDLTKMLEDASSTQVKEDVLRQDTGYEARNTVENNLLNEDPYPAEEDSYYSDEDEYEEDIDEEIEDLYEKIRKQSLKYEQEIERMQKSRVEYEAARKALKDSSKKRGHFELDLSKSNLEGDTLLERLGYDKTAKGNPKYHRMENYIDSHIKDSKTRIAIYAGVCIVCIIFLIIKFTMFYP